MPARNRAPKVAADQRMARSAWGGNGDTTNAGPGAMENDHRNSACSHKKMVIFHDCASLPEGTYI